MTKTIKTLLIIIGAAFTTNAVLYGMVSNFNFGIAALYILGIMFFFAGVFLDRIIFSAPAIKLVFIIFGVGVLVCFCFCVFLAFYGGRETSSFDEDALIVLGAGLHGDRVSLPLKYRLDKAVDYYKTNPDSVIVTTGGMGPGETTEEGAAMKKYLISRGVPEKNILAETASTSTYENFYYAKKLLDERLGKNYSAAFVTNDFHVFRAGMIARTVGFFPTHLSAKTTWYSIPANYIRECAAVIKYILLKR